MSCLFGHDDDIVSQNILRNTAAEGLAHKVSRGGYEIMCTLLDAAKPVLTVTVKCKRCGRVTILTSK